MRNSTDSHGAVVFEVFIQAGFSELELASVLTTLKYANKVCAEPLFDWKIVSDTPGLLNGMCGTIARASPAVFDHGLADFLIVTGGENCNSQGWLPRVREMRRLKRPVAVLSDAATAYIRSLNSQAGASTTHWSDVCVLREEGYYPQLTTNYAEEANGVVTSAGLTFSSELIFDLISDIMGQSQLAELGGQMLFETLRDRAAEQPVSIGFLSNMFDPLIEKSIRIMQDNSSDPLPIPEISSQIGISVRQLERLFKTKLGTSPSRYYKRLRVKRAHILVTGTKLDMIEIALANGFGSISTLSSAYRAEFGVSPSQARSKKQTLAKP